MPVLDENYGVVTAMEPHLYMCNFAPLTALSMILGPLQLRTFQKGENLKPP